jgi:hypothetical protein
MAYRILSQSAVTRWKLCQKLTQSVTQFPLRKRRSDFTRFRAS